MIKLFLGIYLLILCFGSFISIFTFIFDVFKWHFAEKKVKIVPSSEFFEGGDFNECRKSKDINSGNLTAANGGTVGTTSGVHTAANGGTVGTTSGVHTASDGGTVGPISGVHTAADGEPTGIKSESGFAI